MAKKKTSPKAAKAPKVPAYPDRFSDDGPLKIVPPSQLKYLPDRFSAERIEIIKAAKIEYRPDRFSDERLRIIKAAEKSESDTPPKIEHYPDRFVVDEPLRWIPPEKK